MACRGEEYTSAARKIRRPGGLLLRALLTLRDLHCGRPGLPVFLGACRPPIVRATSSLRVRVVSAVRPLPAFDVRLSDANRAFLSPLPAVVELVPTFSRRRHANSCHRKAGLRRPGSSVPSHYNASWPGNRAVCPQAGLDYPHGFHGSSEDQGYRC